MSCSQKVYIMYCLLLGYENHTYWVAERRPLNGSHNLAISIHASGSPHTSRTSLVGSFMHKKLRQKSENYTYTVDNTIRNNQWDLLKNPYKGMYIATRIHIRLRTLLIYHKQYSVWFTEVPYKGTYVGNNMKNNHQKRTSLIILIRVCTSLSLHLVYVRC